MSTINVNNIDKESGSTLTIGGSGTTVNVSNMVPDVALSNRNLIQNGAMQVAQRATQVTGATAGGYLTCDRFFIALSNLGTWTFDQSTDAPNGFSNSFKMTCTTADASPAAADYLIFPQRIEAQNLQHLAYGTANAKSMTLSFWVKSNKTGSASFVIMQSDNSSKMISKSYTINSANTWEYKTISIPADTAGVINNDNGRGFALEWWLNSGTNFSSGSLQSTWSTYNATNRNPSNLGVGGAVNDYFAITGIQLELNDVATPFEHRSYGEELALCQRYYNSSFTSGNAPSNNNTSLDTLSGVFNTYSTSSGYTNTIFYPTEMRATPTVTFYKPQNLGGNDNQWAYYTGSSWTSFTFTGTDVNTRKSFSVFASKTSAFSTQTAYIMYGAYTADAEL